MTQCNQQAAAEMSADDLAALDHKALVHRCLDLQRAYFSLLNAISLYKRQLDAMRAQTLQSGQIADISRKINIADLRVIAEVAIRDMPHFLSAETGMLYLYDPETRLITLYRSLPATARQPALHLESDEDVLIIHFLRHYREPLVIESISHYERLAGREFRPMPADEVMQRGALLCPLVIRMAQEEQPLLIGALVVGDKSGGFTQHDADIATMMAEMLATAISTSRLLEQMSHLAETDGLTQLYNHRHLQQEIDRQIAAAKRYGTGLTIAMIDIDRFKIFNDTYGHQAGDRMLREVARWVRGAVREQVDVVGRYGGEEFMVIMPNTDLAGGAVAAERIRVAVQNGSFSLGTQTVSTTVSIGVAQYAHGQEKGQLIEAADKALYQAKRAGRNRVVVAAKRHREKRAAAQRFCVAAKCHRRNTDRKGKGK